MEELTTQIRRRDWVGWPAIAGPWKDWSSHVSSRAGRNELRKVTPTLLRPRTTPKEPECNVSLERLAFIATTL